MLWCAFSFQRFCFHLSASISRLWYHTNSDTIIKETLSLLCEFCISFNAVRK